MMRHQASETSVHPSVLTPDLIDVVVFVDSNLLPFLVK